MEVGGEGDSKSVTIAFYSTFWISTEVVYLGRSSGYCIVTWLVPRETAPISARSVYTIQPCTVSHHFTQSHIRRLHACLAEWPGFLRATAVTRWWNRYLNNNYRQRMHEEQPVNATVWSRAIFCTGIRSSATVWRCTDFEKLYISINWI